MADEPKQEEKPGPASAKAAAPRAPAKMAVAPWESELTAQLKEKFGGQIPECSSYLGQNFLIAEPGAVIPVLEFLKQECSFDYLVDVTAVDHPARDERFELIYIVYSFSRNERIRIKACIPDGFRPPTAVNVHATANWLEREVFDMFGIEFEGHPNLRRILMPDGWQGHPLRKDCSILQQDQNWVRENLGIESAQ